MDEERLQEMERLMDAAGYGQDDRLGVTEEDVRALIAEVRRLRDAGRANNFGWGSGMAWDPDKGKFVSIPENTPWAVWRTGGGRKAP